MKNRTAQLIYQSAYCMAALIGTFGSIGFFDHRFNWDFYIYFTNLSSYLCFGVMIAELVQTARKKEDSYVTAVPTLKFISNLGILLTFLVFNILLAGAPGRDVASNYKVGSFLFHRLLPLMYLADWFLFYERGKVKWTFPLLSTIFPLAYMAYVYLHAWLLHFDSSIQNHSGSGALIYPYFFLDLEKQGVGGVIRWIIILFVAFVAAGYLFMGADRLLARRKGRD